MTKIDLLVAIVLGIIGSVFLLVGTLLSRRTKRLKKECVLKREAIVVSIEKHETHSPDDSRMISWYPVYEYSANGSTFRKRSLIGYNKKRFKVGQTVEVFVNPEKPEEFYNKEEHLFQMVFLGIGITAFLAEIIWLAVRFV